MTISRKHRSRIMFALIIVIVVFILLLTTTIVFAMKSFNSSEQVKNLEENITKLENKNLELNNNLDAVQQERDKLKLDLNSIVQTATLSESEDTSDVSSRIGPNSKTANLTSRSGTTTTRSSYNPFSVSEYTVEEINIMLSGTGLEGLGECYKNMETTYGVNVVFAMAVAMHESANGYQLANTNNYYGMRGNSGWMSFDSKESNIMYFGKLMNNSMYKGKDISGIARTYCPDGATHWQNTVVTHMNQLLSKLK